MNRRSDIFSDLLPGIRVGIDMDGVLCDSEAFICEAACRMFAEISLSRLLYCSRALATSLVENASVVRRRPMSAVKRPPGTSTSLCVTPAVIERWEPADIVTSAFSSSRFPPKKPSYPPRTATDTGRLGLVFPNPPSSQMS